MVAIDEQRRRQFEADWNEGKPGEISQYLPPENSESYLATLEELVCIDLEFRWKDGQLLNMPKPPLLESYLEQYPVLRRPELIERLIDHEVWVRCRSSRPANPGEYAERFPGVELSDSVRERMINQDTIEQVPTKDASTQRLENGQRGEQTTPRRAEQKSVRGYEIREVLGRGGMGVVYLARHEQTDRMVALKVATLDRLSSHRRDEVVKRIHQEVSALAGLRHDHLVPVFDVGEIQGSPYYTMPVLDTDLGSEVRRNPLSNRTAADYIAQAARGVEHAHQAGLLHRDLKPHNLMLDRANDRILVTDLGLARRADDVEQLTQTGQVLGTPPYMAPEQIRDASNIDSRADVYALGATLYHLLTSRPPFGASQTAETLRQVLEQDPLSLQQLNRSVDRDLNTICLRCLQKEPHLRYATAGELADDLERYLQDEPIEARPLSSWGRLKRWRRRNPALAKLSLALVSTLMILAIVGLLGWWSTQRQFSRFVASTQQGQLAIDDLFTFVRNEPLLQEPGEESVRRELLRRGLRHYQRLAEIVGDDKSLAKDRFQACVSAALISEALDGPSVSRRQFESALAGFETLPSEIKTTPAVQTALGDAWNGQGIAQRRISQLPEAYESFDQAVQIRRQLALELPQQVQMSRKYANSLMNRGLAQQTLGNWEQAESDQTLAQQKRHELLKQATGNLGVERDFAQGQYNQARLALQQEDWGRAGQLLTDASQRFENLTNLHPNVSQLWLRRVECLFAQSVLAEQVMIDSREIANGDTAPLRGGRNSLEQAMNYLKTLSNLAPNNRKYLLGLIKLYHEAIDRSLALGLTENAQRFHQAAERELFSRFEDDLEALDWRLQRLHQDRLAALISVELGDLTTGKKQLVKVLKDWEQIERLLPKDHSVPIEEWELLGGLLDALEHNQEMTVN